jgi:hypothetical protein
MNTSELHLNEIEVRALGSLIEKDITTPDYYPLSLNNREPVMVLNEHSVRQALSTLQEKRMAGPAGGADSRVTKYEHRLQEVFNFDRRETAVICVLLLRGAQTPGELRGRTDRMYRFEALDDVQATLQKLMDRQPPLVRVLPRQPGTKESRYVHLFAGDTFPTALPDSANPRVHHDNSDEQRIANLEAEVAALKHDFQELKRQVSEFTEQFK